MQNSILNLAFIGGGVNSAIGTTHKIASQMDDKFKVVAGSFSKDNKVNSETAHKWFIPSYYTNYIELLQEERESIDAVVILTPTDSHTQIIIDSLNLNLPVISEKTITNSLKDAYKIKRKLTDSNGFLVTTYNYTGYPMVRELESMISQGALGDIMQVNIKMPQEGYIRLDQNGNPFQPQKWRLKDSGISTLSLDLGTHLSNMITFLTKEVPLEVVAMQNNYGHHKVVDNLMCMIKYSSNIDCQMWYSKTALGHKNGLMIEVYGNKGSVKWFQMNPECLEYNDNIGRNILLERSSKGINVANKERYNRFKSGHPAGFIEAFANYYDDIHSSLIDYKNNPKGYLNNYTFGIDSSILDLSLMEAIEKSITNKKWEKIHLEN